MQIIEDKGLVLKKTIYQDTKLMVCLFTKQHGILNLPVNVSKKQLFKLGCFEVGHIVNLEMTRLKSSFKLNHVYFDFAPKTFRDTLAHMSCIAKLCQTLALTLPEELPQIPFFAFLYNALKAFDRSPCKNTWLSFVFLKWLQSEGVIDTSQIPHLIQNELSTLLQIKKFDDLQIMSKEVVEYIDCQLMAQK